MYIVQWQCNFFRSLFVVLLPNAHNNNEIIQSVTGWMSFNFQNDPLDGGCDELELNREEAVKETR